MSHNGSDAGDLAPAVAPVTRNASWAGADHARTALLIAAFGLLVALGLSLPNAASPNLGERGWAPGTLLPIALGPGAVTAAMWTAYTLGAIAILIALRRPERELPRAAVAVLAVGAALSAPFGSGDHLSYAAYGRILAQGGNPWLVSPIDWRGDSDPVVSAVEAPWREEPSVYGPFATLLHGLTSLGGGDNVRQTVWLWQLLVIAAWLAIRWLLRRILPGQRGRIDVLWTANPLVFSVGVLGAHVDLVATALVVAAVWAIHRYAGLPGAALAGTFAALALSSKFTYAVVLLAILLAIRGRRFARGGVMFGAAALVAGGLHLWAGPNVYDQVERSARAVSLATPWRWLLEAVGGGQDVRTLISVLAALTAIVFAICLTRLTRASVASGSTAARATVDADARVGERALLWLAVLTGAYALAASYTLPWYDVVVWAALPAVAVGLDVVVPILLARLWVMACAYTPGRVLGMTPEVQDLTMAVRTRLAPVVLALVWIWLVTRAVRAASLRRTAGPPRGS
ncbi:hypothetical protein N802_04480 [Knoellia sinensis KCTC 19936]|uniref:DUF2029 domain-containing protein n=1 Tax=Knoellia sinensis KCTC 19936 TaxID=1385520 RepID=A0A0A0J5H7_9MICO|nr:hypothetical protein [Knoellia sinensis]KGN31352.1 hypothetical protein N802_04480 [Knoellia sinensis KCTC 19936]